VIALEVADLVLIASRTLGLDTGQVLDLLDPAAAEQALAQARPGSEPGDPATCAAMLLHALVRQRPLRRGNQQVALAAMLQFLAVNGQDMDPDPPGLTAAMVIGIAGGRLEIKDVADWLAPRLRPGGRAAAWVKEAPMRNRPALPLAERIKRATMRTRPKSVFTRFTDRARRVVVLAQHEARGLGHGSVGTEHLLLGLLAEGEGVAALVLNSLGISLEEARDRVEEIAGRGPGTPAGHIPLTQRARKVLELSPREALQLGHTYVGTEHLLLSLLAERDGIPAQVLAGRGAPDALVRERVVAWVTGRYEQEWAAGVDVRAVIAENQRMHRDLDRLRDLLRQHGIEPDGGTARTA
jgi:prophage maintenance system killer protein